MSTRTVFPIGVSLLCFLLLVDMPVGTPQYLARRMPRFSWDTLPVGWHSSNASGVWSGAQLKELARYAIITLEKDQGVDKVVPPATIQRKGMYWCQSIVDESDLSACLLPNKQAEDQHVKAAKAIKALNPDAVVLSYLNSVIQCAYFVLQSSLLTTTNLYGCSVP